jgi:protein MpaA
VRTVIAGAVVAIALVGCGSAPHLLPTTTVGPKLTTPVKQTLTIGYSVRHRPIHAVVIGDPRSPARMLVVGCIHGNEPAGIAITRRLIATSRQPGVALWVVPVLNPDGLASHTRVNADLVDLNRNFPWHWRPLGPLGDPQYAGPRPMSEPETRAAAALIRRVWPQITIWFHQHATLVDLSGGDPRIERRFARLVGLPAIELARYPGSAASWSNSRLAGTTAFVVELPAGTLAPAAVTDYALAVLALAHTLARSTSRRTLTERESAAAAHGGL